MRTLHGGRSTLVRLAAGATLAASALTMVGGSVVAGHAAPTAGDCATTFPLEEVAEGDPVTGLTVARGTTPAPFEGTVIGVLEDGIGVGLDMIIMDLDSPDIDRAGGIWSGMSGSPVYAADGRLIGAVSYGLSAGNSKVAGVTPIEAMRQISGATSSAPQVTLPQRTARAVAAASGLSTADARQGLQRLPMPMAATGVDVRRAKQAGAARHVKGVTGGTVGRSGAELGSETIVAGGNLGASVSYGDVMLAGVGTVTTVCDGTVIGFGHPLAHLGQTSASLHGASALYVQPDSLDTPFKVARLGAAIGTIDQDRLAGIKGFVGQAPSGIPIRVRATLAQRTYDGTSIFTAGGAEYLTSVAYGQFAASLDRVVDARVPGQVLVKWTLSGTKDGRPFTLRSTNRQITSYDISYEAGDELAEILWNLLSLPGIKVTGITAETVADLDSSVARVTGVQRRRKGTWVAVPNRSAVTVKAGKSVKLRAVVTRGSRTTYAPLTVKGTRKMRGQVLRARFVGGGQRQEMVDFRSLRGLQKFLDTRQRADTVLTYLTGPGETPQSVEPRVSSPREAVVLASRVVRVRVR